MSIYVILASTKEMHKTVLYGVIAAIVVATGIGITFATMSNNDIGSAVTNPPTNNDVRVIKHAMGETAITGTPQRIITLDSTITGDVRALGVMPIATTDRDWYDEMLTPIGYGLSNDVSSVGSIAEPNLETILQLEPDLIIGKGGKWGQPHIMLYDQLSAIAPTILLNPDPRPDLDELEVAQQNFMTTADALNRQREGAAWLENVESYYKQAAAKLEQAGLKGAKFVLVQSYLDANGTPGVGIFTQGAFASLLMNKLGLENKVPDQTTTEDTWYWIGMEGVAAVDDPDTHLLITYNVGDAYNGGNPLAVSPIWNNLEFVKNRHTYDIGASRLFGQILFAEDLANKVVNTMTSDNNEVRMIKHALGETEIVGVPKRIVALSWPLGADLLTLGIKPVGMGNVNTFNDIVNLDAVVLPSDVANVGLPWEPNLEVIAGLEPDLIIGATHDNELIYKDLSNIAPTLIFDVFVEFPGQEGPNELELMEQNFMTIADVVGKHGEGTVIINNMHAKFAAAEARLESNGLGDEKFALAYIQSDATTMWIWIDALNTQLLERVGLENAYKTAYEAEYQYDYDFGGVSWGLEGLAIVDDPRVHFIFRQHATDTGIPDAWEGNPVWEGLAFVKAGHVYPHASLYVYAGPRAAEVFVDTVVNMLTGS